MQPVGGTGPVELNGTGMKVSRICVGTWSWGSRFVWGYGRSYGKTEVRAAYTEALRRGVNFFDTAELYGYGASEKLLGGCIKGAPEGAQPVVATKFSPLVHFGKGSVEKALRRSLWRLGVRTVHLYQVHQMDKMKKIPRWMDAMADLQQKGLIRAIGVSNYYPEHLEAACDALDKRGQKLASDQMHFSLLFRRHERNGLLRLCRERNIAFLAYMPLTWGLLAGKYGQNSLPHGLVRRLVVKRLLVERTAGLLRLMKDIAYAGKGRTVAQVALNWVIAKGAIPIVGVKTPNQAADDLGALEWSLSPAEVEELDAASDALGPEPLKTIWDS